MSDTPKCPYCDDPWSPYHACDGMVAEAARRVVASPDLDATHRMVKMNLTTRFQVDYAPIMLMWMQIEPGKWDGLHPEECLNLGTMLGA